MNQEFDNLVNSVLNEEFGNKTAYNPGDNVECPFRLRDSLATKGIQVSDADLTALYDKYKNKPYADAEKEVNGIRSKKEANNPPNPYGQMDPQNPTYRETKVSSLENPQY